MLLMVRTCLSPLRVGMRQVLDDRRSGRLYSSCGSELRMAASQFMRCGSTGEIEDVLEFQIAKAIIAGDMQVISHEPHLFELCLDFNRDDTAMALLTHGVPGCRLEVWHLGPYAHLHGPRIVLGGMHLRQQLGDMRILLLGIGHRNRRMDEGLGRFAVRRNRLRRHRSEATRGACGAGCAALG